MRAVKHRLPPFQPCFGYARQSSAQKRHSDQQISSHLWQRNVSSRPDMAGPSVGGAKLTLPMECPTFRPLDQRFNADRLALRIELVPALAHCGLSALRASPRSSLSVSAMRHRKCPRGCRNSKPQEFLLSFQHPIPDDNQEGLHIALENISFLSWRVSA